MGIQDKRGGLPPGRRPENTERSRKKKKKRRKGQGRTPAQNNPALVGNKKMVGNRGIGSGTGWLENDLHGQTIRTFENATTKVRGRGVIGCQAK